MVALTCQRDDSMMVVRFGIQLPALTAFHDNTMRIVVGNIDQQLGLAGSAPIGLVTAPLPHRRTGRVLKHIRIGGGGWRKNDHVELGHGTGLAIAGYESALQTAQRHRKCQRPMSLTV
jgi:hypothetical protein